MGRLRRMRWGTAVGAALLMGSLLCAGEPLQSEEGMALLDEGAVPPAALRAIRSVKKNDGKAKAREAKAHQVNIARAREKLQAKKMRARAKLTVVKAAHKKILRAKVRAIKKVKRAVAK